MRADLGAQVMLSVLAHVGVFFATNSYLSSAETSQHRIILNQTYATSSEVQVRWDILSTETFPISKCQVTLFPQYDQSDSLNQVHDVDFDKGYFTFNDLLSDTAYNICLVISTSQRNNTAQCIVAKTKDSAFSRLNLLKKTSEKNMSLFIMLTVVSVMLILVVWAANLYCVAARNPHFTRLIEDRQDLDQGDPLLTKEDNGVEMQQM